MRWWMIAPWAVVAAVASGLAIALPAPSWTWAVLACGGAVTALAGRRSAVALAVGVALLLAAGFGATAAARYDAARATLPAGLQQLTGRVVDQRLARAGQAWTVIETDAEGGPRVRVLAPPSAALGPGARVALTGRLQPETQLDDPGAAGVMLYPRIDLLDAADPGPVQRLRATIGDRLRSVLPEPEASLARGLLIGSPQFAPEFREALAASGTSHIVAVSGYNVAIVAVVAAALGWLVLGRRSGMAVALAVVLGYCLLTGTDQPSVWRAGVMWLAVCLAWCLRRDPFALNALALAIVALVVWTPWTVFDISFQLSVAGTVGLVSLGLVLAYEVPEAVEDGRAAWQVVALAAMVTVMATLYTAPIVLFHFGTVPLAGVLANLLILPLVPLAMFLSALTALAPLAPVAALAWVPLAAITLVVDVVAGWAGLAIQAPIALWQVVLAYVGLAVVTIAAGRGLRTHALTRLRGALAASPVARWSMRPPALTSGLTLLGVAVLAWVVTTQGSPAQGVWMLDVGQGDALLIKTRLGGRVLVDAAADGRVLFTALDRELLPWDRRLDLVIASHHQLDHIGGLAELLGRGGVGSLVVHDAVDLTAEGRALVAQAQATNTPARRVSAGDVIRVDEALTLRVLSRNPGARTTENDRSLVILAELDGWRILLTGDLEPAGAFDLLASGADLRADVLKVPHHGSRNGLTPALLAEAQPAIALISAGRENRFGHPAPEVLAMLQGLSVWRTDRHGTVAVLADRDGLRIVPRR